MQHTHDQSVGELGRQREKQPPEATSNVYNLNRLGDGFGGRVVALPSRFAWAHRVDWVVCRPIHVRGRFGTACCYQQRSSIGSGRPTT